MSKRCTIGFGIDHENERIPMIETIDVTLGELAEGYNDTSDDYDGEVVSWNGKLNLRPKFQRSLIVDNDKEWQVRLLDSVVNGKPINDIYFGKINNSNFFDYKTKYVLVDGQQRLITLLAFISGNLALMHNEKGQIHSRMFNELSDEEKNLILNYKPNINVSVGTEKAVLEWFKIINQPNHSLTNQEIRNATYTGPFIEDAKKYFSYSKANEKDNKTTIENGDILKNERSTYYYERFCLGCDPNRQEVLEFALDLISYRDYIDSDFVTSDERINEYLRIHRYDENANELVSYYKKVYDWITDVFYHNDNNFLKKYKASTYQAVRHQPWAEIYHKYHNIDLTEEDKIRITDRCKFWVSLGASWYNKASGIFEWVLRGEKVEEMSMLYPRCFREGEKRHMYELQGGIDPITEKYFDYCEAECHHIVPWKNGGLTVLDNLIILPKTTHENIDIYGLTPDEIKEKKEAIIKKMKSLLTKK